MKYVIEFRGVGIPEIREAQKNWVNEYLINLSFEKQINIAMELFEQDFAEDKLAGILLFENYLFDKLPIDIIFEKYEIIFDNNLIFDWNICDWFCIRVLKKTIDLYGHKAAIRISKWKNSKNVWKARASIVSFIGLTKDDKYLDYIFENCKILIKREERFAKTAVGWILHDIYKYNKESVINFIDLNLNNFSPESLKNAIKYSDNTVKSEYMLKFKMIRTH